MKMTEITESQATALREFGIQVEQKTCYFIPTDLVNTIGKLSKPAPKKRAPAKPLGNRFILRKKKIDLDSDNHIHESAARCFKTVTDGAHITRDTIYQRLAGFNDLEEKSERIRQFERNGIIEINPQGGLL